MNTSLDINPNTTIYNLLESYPELEDILIAMAPPFKKLKNPFLRKSVAKVATLKHAATVGGIQLDEMISILRKTVGLTVLDETYNIINYLGKKPNWFNLDKVVHSINESTFDDDNKMTITHLLKQTKDLQHGEIIELITSFIPAPGIDLMNKKGFNCWTKKESETIFKSYFIKS